MIRGRRHGTGVIVLTFVIALLLTVIPLPDWARYLRPDWVGLVLIYWCMALPDRVGWLCRKATLWLEHSTGAVRDSVVELVSARATGDRDTGIARELAGFIWAIGQQVHLRAA